MTTTDPEEVHRLRQRLEKSEATRAKLRASLIALKVCLPDLYPISTAVITVHAGAGSLVHFHTPTCRRHADAAPPTATA